MRAVLWTTTLLLIGSGILLGYSLQNGRLSKLALPGEQSWGLNEIIGIVSLLLNILLFVIAMFSLYVALVTYLGAEKSGRGQQVTLEASRKALEETSGILKTSAKDFRDSASAAIGQYGLLQAEKSERDKAVLVAIRDEIANDLNLLTRNQDSLRTELIALGQNRQLVEPLSLLHVGAWQLLRVSIPERFFKQEGTLKAITDAFDQANLINEIVQSRENYRIHNQAMGNFTDRMKNYDEDLIPKNQALITILDSLKRKLADVKVTN